MYRSASSKKVKSFCGINRREIFVSEKNGDYGDFESECKCFLRPLHFDIFLLSIVSLRLFSFTSIKCDCFVSFSDFVRSFHLESTLHFDSFTSKHSEGKIEIPKSIYSFQ